MQPALLDRYLAAATKIARLAVGDPTHARLVRALHGAEGQLERDRPGSRRTTGSAKSSRLGRAAESRHATTSRSMASTSSRSAWIEPTPGSFAVSSGATTSRFASTACESGSSRSAARRSSRARQRQLRMAATSMRRARSRPPMSGLEVRVPVKAGMRHVIGDHRQVRQPRRRGTWPECASRSGAASTRTSPDNPLMISALLIGGPYDGRPSPDSPSRRRLFVCAADEQPRRDGLRDADSDDAGTARVSPPADQRRHPDARRLLSTPRGRSGDFDAGIRAGARAASW